MHSYTAVIIPPNQQNPEIWVKELLAPYNLNLEVEAYKEYINEKELKYLKRHHRISNIDDLVKKLSESTPIFADEKGIYELSTFNKNGHWDYWIVGGNWDKQIARGEPSDIPLKYKDEDWYQYSTIVKKTCLDGFAIIVTPDGAWHDCYDFGWTMIKQIEDPNKNKKAWENWQKYKEDILSKYLNHVLLAIDVHS